MFGIELTWMQEWSIKLVLCSMAFKAVLFMTHMGFSIRNDMVKSKIANQRSENVK